MILRLFIQELKNGMEILEKHKNSSQKTNNENYPWILDFNTDEDIKNITKINFWKFNIDELYSFDATLQSVMDSWAVKNIKDITKMNTLTTLKLDGE